MHVARSISTTQRWVAFDHVGNRVGSEPHRGLQPGGELGRQLVGER